MASKTNRIIFKSSFWVQILVIPLPIIMLTILEIHIFSSGENFVTIINILFATSCILSTIWIHRELHIKITVCSKFIIYKKGIFPNRFILKNDIYTILKKGSYSKRGPLSILLKIKEKKKFSSLPTFSRKTFMKF